MGMGRLEFTTPREAWGGEATAYTPLLAEDDMLRYLGEATGIGPLDLVDVEHATAGNRSLDILAETRDGRRVAIENQYRRADHDHLTRGLAYAVATDSRALVVIAEDHGDEFISVADYLNSVALAGDEAGITVWLVRAVRRIGDSIWSPEFVVLAGPNEWEAAMRRGVRPVLGSLGDFYGKCESPEWADFARSTIEEWLQRPGASESHRSQGTVGLYHVSPRQPHKGTTVLALDLKGEFTICRGRIWYSTGAYDPEVEPAALDAAIREFCPGAFWRQKGHFIAVDHRSDDVAGFTEWLADALNTACEKSRDATTE